MLMEIIGDDWVNRSIPYSIQMMLQCFQDVFATPREMPSSKNQDHQITLKKGAEPTSVRPCYYPYVQKA